MIEKYIDFSYVQNGIYYGCMSGWNREYNISVVVELSSLDLDSLNKAVALVVREQELMRACIGEKGGEPILEIHDKAVLNIDTVDVYDLSKEIIIEKLNEFVSEEITLDVPGMFGIKIFRVSDDTSYVAVKAHHLIMDGISMSLLMHSIMKYYFEIFNNGKEPDIAINTGYSLYVENQVKKESEKGFALKKRNWMEHLEDARPVDLFRKNIPDIGVGRAKKFPVSDETVNAAKKIAAEYGITEYSFYLAVFFVLLNKTTHVNDLTISAPFSTRDSAKLRNTIGSFACVYPLRMKLHNDERFSDILSDSFKEVMFVLKNIGYPNYRISEENFENGSKLNYWDISFNNDIFNKEYNDMDFSIVDTETITFFGNFSLSFANDIDGSYYINLCYKDNLVTADEAECIGKHYLNILETVINDPEIELKDIDILSAEEKNLILNKFNETANNYPTYKTVIDLFEEQVTKTPDNTAIVFENENITYSMLDRKTSCLAYKLHEAGISSDDFVAIIADRSIEMIIAIYAVLKSGGAYVPIDPTYPDERIKYIIDDCKPKAVIINTKERLDIHGETVIIDMRDDKIIDEEHDGFVVKAAPSDLAYCLYTSGTTGKAKGVLIEHRNLVAYVSQFIDYFNIDSRSVVLQQAYIGFDTSIEEIYPVLMTGGKIVVVNKDTLLDSEKLRFTINDEKITMISCSPLLINEMDYLNNSSVRILISGGDVLRKEYIKKFADSQMNIYNTYGPTEATVCATYYKVNHSSTETSIPIGKPISNVKIYITNKGGLCGIGVPGELCISGAGIARGYLNRAELTTEKFVSNPYGEGKMYRTGDLAKWLPDGNIEYMGRIDNQVKIRGFRIEIGEIENCIHMIDNIKDCAVIARDNEQGEKNLYAYFVASCEIDISFLRSELKKILPGYMVPAYIMQLDKLPTNKSGKIDKNALPMIVSYESNEIIMPRNEIEEALLNVYKTVFHKDNLSVTENFFDIGGNSIKIIKVFLEIGKIYPDTVKVVDLFSNPTIEQLAKFIECKLNGVKDKFSIIGVKMPAYLLGDQHEENEWIEASLSIEVSDVINNTFNGKVFEFLTAAYILTLSKLSETNRITIQCLKAGTDDVYQITTDLSEVENFFDIIGTVRKILNENVFSYTLSDYFGIVKSDISVIVPLITDGKLKYEYSEKYDLSIGVSIGDRIKIEAASNCNYLSSSSVSEIVEAYISIISAITKSL